MAFCGKCGTSLAEGVSFCTNCGAPVRAGAAGQASSAPSPAGAPQAAGSSQMAPNVAAALSYVLGFITGIAFLVIEPYKNDRYVRFHAFQSVFFSAALLIFWILWSNLIWIGIGGLALLGILGLISTLISLGSFLYWLFLMYKAYNNERYMIPIIGEFASKQAG